VISGLSCQNACRARIGCHTALDSNGSRLCSMLKSLSITGYLAMVGGLVALLAMRSLLSLSPLVILVQAAALLLFLWARVTFGRRSFHVRADPTEGGLVTAGPYRYIRHPIYSAMCLMT